MLPDRIREHNVPLHSALAQIMQMLLCFNRIITQMPASSAPCLLKFPLDLLLSVEPANLQRDRNTIGPLIFQHGLCVHLALLIIIDCRSECALHSKLKADKAATEPCIYVAKRTICSHLLLKEEWCRKINCQVQWKILKSPEVDFFHT